MTKTIARPGDTKTASTSKKKLTKLKAFDPGFQGGRRPYTPPFDDLQKILDDTNTPLEIAREPLSPDLIEKAQQHNRKGEGNLTKKTPPVLHGV